MTRYSARPYFRYSLTQLREISDSSRTDVAVLRILAAELQYRSTFAAIQLRGFVESRLDQLQHQTMPPDPHEPVQAPTQSIAAQGCLPPSNNEGENVDTACD